MKRQSILPAALIGLLTIVCLSASLRAARPQESQRQPAVDADDIGGVVTSAKGAEAGVWVIAETAELPTKMVKIVVTDDQGRYVLPDLPKAHYRVWVRGYGLVDSQPVTASTGKILNLTAVVAPDPRAAAEYYPSDYWFSLLHIPPPSDFPGTGAKGNGISEKMKSQAQWIGFLKTTGCEACHQIGDKATREIPKSLGTFDSSVAAWDRRVKSGQDASAMGSYLGMFGRERALQLFADWTDRIAAGEFPKEAPSRPQGLERNVVITEWDWADPTQYVHDAVSTDKRNPAVNANGPLYGPNEVSSDNISVLDPAHDLASQLSVPTRDPSTPFASPRELLAPWRYWGDQIMWNGRTSPHTSVIDRQGRLWTASAIRPPQNPDFCREGSSLPSAKVFPMSRSGRQVSLYDPKSKQFTLINTCFSTQHLQFAEDSNDTLWFSSGYGPGDVVGWLNTKMFDETHDEQKSQGWTPLILDTNGNGKRDDYVEPDQPVDPTKDKRIKAAFYGIVSDPVDGAIWGSFVNYPDGIPGAIVRLNPGPNPPMTALAEIYEPPWGNLKAPVQGYTPRGIDIDRNGVVWTNLSGSGHFASFDRRKCKVVNGPAATGQHCPEGWTLYPLPGPSFRSVEGSKADASYFNWVDQFDTLGLGKNVPIAIGNGSDSLMALLPGSGKWVVLRVPYPMGFYAKGLDGRIDDAKAGWKGREVWSSYDTRTPWHIEGGKGTRSKVVKFQLRPDPLAN